MWICSERGAGVRRQMVVVVVVVVVVGSGERARRRVIKQQEQEQEQSLKLKSWCQRAPCRWGGGGQPSPLRHSWLSPLGRAP